MGKLRISKEFENCECINNRRNIEIGVPQIENIGWSLGNACPYNCKHCYSRSVRKQGKNLTKEIIDRIISQISKLNVKTINLGGNEPWFTNGLYGESLLPYILEQLNTRGYKVGITTSGISLLNICKYSPESLKYINDIDISLDSPNEKEHNESRGANIYKLAIESLKIAQKHNIEHSIIICAMKWNFTLDNLDKLIDLAIKYDANIRFNVLKPLEKKHMEMLVPMEQFYKGYEYLLNHCETIDITEPRLSSLVRNKKRYSCPCGNTSMRIHSITPEGEVFVSPCIYLHDFKVGDLLKDDIIDIITSEPFQNMQIRNYYYRDILDCSDCKYGEICGGGCAAQAYLTNYWRNGKRSLLTHEEDCLKFLESNIDVSNYSKIMADDGQLVHINYLCTWIGKPHKDYRR
ncbi:MAG: radical SAM protein [Clostridium argentinense]|nr:radical SAM protein [uncultured Clostridium sp.]MBS5824682.1 radical SAM protein [Clostridium argentinense]MDU1350864.1 radical SAM protein [Clostridium argentinense]